MVRNCTQVLRAGALVMWACSLAFAETNFSRINGFEPRFLPPVNARITNIKTEYAAKGDGVTDDTKAFQNALFAGRMMIYIPAGTYLIKDQIRIRDGIKRTMFIGEQRSTTVIKLADNSPGFSNPASPKVVLHTRAPAQFGEQNFHHYIYHLTIEIGKGNAGAIGINHHTNNTGQVKDVCVRATDPVNGKGLVGIAFADWWYGPGGGRYLEVDGFKSGIYVTSAQNHVTLEHVNARNCDVGLDIQYYPDTVFTVSCRDLVTTNCGMGVKNGGSLALIESDLGGSGPSAINNRGSLLCRDVATGGFTKAIVSSTPRGDLAGPGIDHYTSHAPQFLWDPAAGQDRTMALRWEESPEIQYPSSAAGWTIVGSTGDVGQLIQQAIDAGATDILHTGGRISSTVTLRNAVRRIMGTGSRPIVLATPGQPTFRVADGTPPAVIVELVYPDYGSNFSSVVEQASKRTTVFRHGAGTYTTAAAGVGGKVFIESVVGNFSFNGVKAWCRDINTEGAGIEVTSNNSTLIIMGHRTETYATKIRTTGGGYTELLGGVYRQNFDFARQISGGIDTVNPPPLFLIDNSHATFHYRDSDCFGVSTGLAFKWSVREIRGSVTRNKPRTSELCGAVALYVGYTQRPPDAVDVSSPRRGPSLDSQPRQAFAGAAFYDVRGRKMTSSVRPNRMTVAVSGGRVRMLSPVQRLRR